MFEKDRRRGERRWRSFHAWMRRLQNDWWTHGTRINPRGIYLHMKETGVCTIKQGANWRDRFYCDCFDFELQGNYRFKNHPTGNMSEAAYRKRDGYFVRELWESRWLEVEREKYGKPGGRKRHLGEYRKERKCCFTCGYFLGFVWAKVGKYTFAKYSSRCENCKKRFEEKKLPA
jgi:hypothetical protein